MHLVQDSLLVSQYILKWKDSISGFAKNIEYTTLKVNIFGRRTFSVSFIQKIKALHLNFFQYSWLYCGHFHWKSTICILPKTEQIYISGSVIDFLSPTVYKLEEISVKKIPTSSHTIYQILIYLPLAHAKFSFHSTTKC